MNARADPSRQSFGLGSNYVFGRNVDDRQRLQYQFSLLREDFNLWFDETLRLGGPTDPDEADWSVLDVGCGEGQFSREIARRYPNANVVGIDVDGAAIAAASAASADEANVRFLMRDARQLAAEGLTPEGGFDAAFMWMLLLYLPDKQAALANLAATLAPGGVLLLGNVPDEPMSLDHPAVAPIMATGHQALAQVGLVGLERDIGPLLEQAGFGSVTTVTLRYPIGGATSHGHRWFGYSLASISAGRRLVVDVCGLMDGADYDRRARLVTHASSPPRPRSQPPGSAFAGFRFPPDVMIVLPAVVSALQPIPSRRRGAARRTRHRGRAGPGAEPGVFLAPVCSTRSGAHRPLGRRPPTADKNRLGNRRPTAAVSALNTAVRKKKITVNPAENVELASGRAPRALAWTDARVAAWRRTGRRPSPVMVWTGGSRLRESNP